MTSTIQIPNITINGNDYWDSHKSQYNAMIGESISPLTLDLKGYPTNNTISIVDPNNEYEYKDNNDNNIIDYSLIKNTNLTIKIEKMPEFWEVPREITAQGVYQIPSSNFSVTMPNSVTSIGYYGLYYCFRDCTSLTSFNENGITSIGTSGLSYCFSGCTSLTTASAFNNLTSIGSSGLSYCFKDCTSLTTAPAFASLTSIGSSGLSYCFQGCTSLTTAPAFASLTSIGSSGLSYCFKDCTSLTTAPAFASLTSIGSSGLVYCFQNTKITSLSFPALTSSSFGSSKNQFNNMLSGVTGCTVHFPSNLQSKIGSWSSVKAGFGGTSTIVSFDLTATT